jgi:uncharacterized delta-60 repeat protein
MSHLTKVAGTWRNSKPYTKVAGTWKLADYVYNKVGGRWYTSFVKGGLVDKSWDDRDQTGVFGTGAGTGSVYAIAFQSDGKILVGGYFTSWNGTTVGNIVRLNADGTRDTAFTTNTGTGANSYILSVAIQSDGKILVGGEFSSWNGTAVNYIVRLNSDGTRDTAFTTNTGTGADDYIFSVAIQSDGKILVGGFFGAWNGTTVGRIVRLNSDGTRDTAFTTNTGTGADDYIFSVAIQSDGKILLGGYFTSWNGTTVNRTARLNSDGTRDTAFTTNTGTGANNVIYTIAIQSDGKILVGGNFSAWNGTTVGRIVRLNSDGTRDTAFTTNTGTGADSSIETIAIQSDGKILVGGYFTSWNGTAVNYIVRLNSDGTRDTAFTTNTGTGANSSIETIAIQSDGKSLVGGFFGSWNGTAVGRIVRLNSDGTSYETLSAFATSTTTCVAIQSDGKILVGGFFTAWNGITVGRFVRLNSDGAMDTAFTTNTGTGANSSILSVAIQSDGKILVGGSFTTWNGTTVNRIVRLNSDGTRDTAFTTNTGTGANTTIETIAIQSDGKIIVGGSFTIWNGATVGFIVRLNSNGTRDTSFTTNTGTGANTTIVTIAIQSDGKILVGGNFTVWNGTAVGRIVRLNADGTRDTAFTTNTGTGASGGVVSIAIQSDGKILVGGNFGAWNGTTVTRIVRLNSDGTRDTAFTTNAGNGANNTVRSVTIQSDRKILLAGTFTSFNALNQFRRFFVRIGGEDAS